MSETNSISFLNKRAFRIIGKDLWKFLRFILFSLRARYSCPIQANRYRNCLEYYPAIDDDDYFTIILAKLQTAGFRSSICAAGLRRNVSWQFLPMLSEASNSLGKRINAQQSLFSKTDHTCQFSDRCIDWFLHFSHSLLDWWFGTALSLQPKIIFTSLSFACYCYSRAGFWIAALNVKYRDFRYVVPFIVQFGLYVSPVGFPVQSFPKSSVWFIHWIQWLV